MGEHKKIGMTEWYFTEMDQYPKTYDDKVISQN